MMLRAIVANTRKAFTQVKINYPVRFFSQPIENNYLVIIGKEGQRKVKVDDIKSLASRYKATTVDIGTGDGKFPYREARSNPEKFYIGIDATNTMSYIASKAQNKPNKGGVSNVTYVMCPVESLPLELNNIADSITINYPWGSLLSGLIKPEPLLLRKISALGKPSCKLKIAINYNVFYDHALLEKLDLPKIDVNYIETTLKTLYLKCGIRILDYTVTDQFKKERTSWGGKLYAGRREIAFLDCIVGPKLNLSLKDDIKPVNM